MADPQRDMAEHQLTGASHRDMAEQRWSDRAELRTTVDSAEACHRPPHILSKDRADLAEDKMEHVQPQVTYPERCSQSEQLRMLTCFCNTVPVHAISVRQPYALLIAYGLKIAEFRSKRLFAIGTRVWVVSSKHMPSWDCVANVLAKHAISVSRLESMVGGAITPLNYLHWFPRQCVLARVLIAGVVPSVDSASHRLNPKPTRWTWALEMDELRMLRAEHRRFLSHARPGVFQLDVDMAEDLHLSLWTYE